MVVTVVIVVTGVTVLIVVTAIKLLLAKTFSLRSLYSREIFEKKTKKKLLQKKNSQKNFFQQKTIFITKNLFHQNKKNKTFD